MRSSVLVHLAAHAHGCPVVLTEHAPAAWLWSRLSAAFPDAAAAILMPDHVHLVTPTRDVERARVTFARVVGNLKRARVGGGDLRWGRVETPRLVVGPEKLLRHLRYVALNPVRAGLTSDPLAWPWSTYRDVMGAIVAPWVTAARVAALVGQSATTFRRRFHRYVSADPSCDVAGSPEPHRASATDLLDAPLAWVAEAAASASRGTAADVRRRTPTRALFLATVRHEHGHAPSRLATLCSMTTRGVHAAFASPTAPSRAAIDTALLCLGDPRLRLATSPSGIRRPTSEIEHSERTSLPYPRPKFSF